MDDTLTRHKTAPKNAVEESPMGRGSTFTLETEKNQINGAHPEPTPCVVIDSVDIDPEE